MEMFEFHLNYCLNFLRMCCSTFGQSRNVMFFSKVICRYSIKQILFHISFYIFLSRQMRWTARKMCSNCITKTFECFFSRPKVRRACEGNDNWQNVKLSLLICIRFSWEFSVNQGSLWLDIYTQVLVSALESNREVWAPVLDRIIVRCCGQYSLVLNLWLPRSDC